MPLLIDAHLDLSWNALSFDRDLTESIEQINTREHNMTDTRARGNATVGLPEMQRGMVAVCLGTLLARARSEIRPNKGHLRISLDFRSPSAAYGIAQGQLAYYRLLEQDGHITMLATADDLQAHWQRWASADLTAEGTRPPLGLILAMEGADSIVAPEQAEAWFQQGLRAVNPVHYGQNQYAVGTGDSGPLTPAGVVLLQEFERLGIILDATHLSDPSFFQALDVYSGPVLASHQNCRSLVPGDRQFSDEQIGLLIERDAILGAAFDNWMIVPDWKTGQVTRSDVTLERIVDHTDHICQLAGNHRHVAIGSDLDGGFGTEQSPVEIETIADIQKLVAVFERRGYTPDAINAIFHGNWLRFFLEHLPKKSENPESSV